MSNQQQRDHPERRYRFGGARYISIAQVANIIEAIKFAKSTASTLVPISQSIGLTPTRAMNELFAKNWTPNFAVSAACATQAKPSSQGR
jgi:hypothetical protein